MRVLSVFWGQIAVHRFALSFFQQLFGGFVPELHATELSWMQTKKWSLVTLSSLIYSTSTPLISVGRATTLSNILSATPEQYILILRQFPFLPLFVMHHAALEMVYSSFIW